MTQTLSAFDRPECTLQTFHCSSCENKGKNTDSLLHSLQQFCLDGGDLSLHFCTYEIVNEIILLARYCCLNSHSVVQHFNSSLEN